MKAVEFMDEHGDVVQIYPSQVCGVEAGSREGIVSIVTPAKNFSVRANHTGWVVKRLNRSLLQRIFGG